MECLIVIKKGDAPGRINSGTSPLLCLVVIDDGSITLVLLQLTVRFRDLLVRVWEDHHVILISPLVRVVLIVTYRVSGLRIRAILVVTDARAGIQLLLGQFLDLGVRRAVPAFQVEEVIRKLERQLATPLVVEVGHRCRAAQRLQVRAQANAVDIACRLGGPPGHQVSLGAEE